MVPPFSSPSTTFICYSRKKISSQSAWYFPEASEFDHKKNVGNLALLFCEMTIQILWLFLYWVTYTFFLVSS